ncbi:hypothetical protein [Mesorhizobium sp.]|uniref:hypothetical protein n=1 Tax=Mesorhizobium sp. TaxID=1871066 RepID=UPI00257EEBA9|nr:hypothetical protein [Mesorhizobium sp.]
MRYRTNNEGTGYRGKDHDQPIKPEAEHFEHCPICGQDFDMRDLARCFTMRGRSTNRFR